MGNKTSQDDFDFDDDDDNDDNDDVGGFFNM